MGVKVSHIWVQRYGIFSRHHLRRQFSFQEAVSLNSFKKLILKWVSQVCPCRLCKNYIPGVGFVESLP